MTIHVDKEQEWDPFVKDVMGKLDNLEKKIIAVNFNISLLLSKSETKTEEPIKKVK